MSGQIVGYVRVSSTEQNPARQLAAIGTVDETFTDRVSGKSRSERPELARMLRHVRRGDTVRVSSMDRLARSVIDLAQIIHELNGKEVEVEFTTERLTFAPGAEDPFAMFQLHMLGAVAQLERSLIKERQREGIDLARAKGVYRGRARALSPEQITEARDMVATGVPKAKIARELGCSRRVLYDALQGRGAYGADPSEESPERSDCVAPSPRANQRMRQRR